MRGRKVPQIRGFAGCFGSGTGCETRESRFQKDGNTQTSAEPCLGSLGRESSFILLHRTTGAWARLVIAGQGEMCESRDQVREDDAFHRLKRLPASVDHLFPCIRECGYRIVVVT